MQKYAIQIAYDGTDYCGWQIQSGIGVNKNPKPSIQEELHAAIEDLCGERAQTVSSGRTDAGVHANGQVVHFSLKQNSVPEENLLQGLNHRLPTSIRIHRLGRAPHDFRAQNACRKQYSYYFQQGPANLPHLKNYTMWNRYPLNGGRMSEALQSLTGNHDFIAFCGTGAKVSTTVRTIYEAEVAREPIPLPGLYEAHSQFLWRVRIVGSGFLKHMVRGIAGTLKQIGEETRPVEDMVSTLSSGDREKVGPSAPASGLWLDQVWYPKQEGIDFLAQFPSQSKI